MDEQVVKLLQSIEKLLKTATSTAPGAGGGGLKSMLTSKVAQIKQNRDDKNTAKVFQAFTGEVKSADKAMLALTQSMVTLKKEVHKTSSGFSTLQSQMARFGAQLTGGPATRMPGVPATRGGGGGGSARVRTPVLGGGEGGAGPATIFGNLSQRVAASGVSVTLFEGAVKHGTEALKKLTVDFFSLARVGMGSVGTLKELSIDAALAGMSLQEYTTLVKENMAFASRAGSMANFAKIASASDDMLASMGVFGAEARDLQAALANANTMAGVSAGKLVDAGAQQIKMFDKLRKSTNMTASEFANLVKSVSENDQTQRELVGLAPAEKQARMTELLNITATGQKLGLTGKASEELAAALIAQRKETVQTRFEAAGRIMQLGAFAGQGAEAQRAAQLIRKGRGKTAPETEELRKLLQGIDKASQGLYEAGDFAVQNIIDQLGPDAGQGLGAAGDIMKASRVVENTASAGEVFNKDFGQHVDKFGQVVGKAIALFRGWDKSTGPAIAAAVGSALLMAFRGPVLGVLKGALGFGAAGARGAAVGAGAGAGGALAGGAATVFSFKGLGLGAGFISAIVEMFTGEISEAMNPGGGFMSRIGGMITAFFSAIPNMIISTIGFFFSENVAQSLQNGFDQFASFMMGAVRGFFADMFDGLSTALSWFGLENSGLAKSLKKWGGEARDAADQNFKAFDTLAEDHGKTLSSISKDNQKAADTAVKTTDAATAKATAAASKFNNVQMGNTITAGQVLQDARTILASPQVQVPAPVTPGTINTTETAPAREVTTAAPVAGGSDVLTVLQAILQVLNQSLAAEEAQVAFTKQLARSKTEPFITAEVTANRLLKQG